MTILKILILVWKVYAARLNLLATLLNCVLVKALVPSQPDERCG